MEFLIVLAATFLLLWFVFIRPQQRRVREHQRLVASLQVGDEVVLTAGIFGRITALGAEEVDLEVSPGVELRVARQAVLRKVETLPEPPVDDADAGVEADRGAGGEPPPDAGPTRPPGRDAPPGDQP
ncbi:MAG: preprotein translocase subunit YajC [Acidimicrobiia bacterium]